MQLIRQGGNAYTYTAELAAERDTAEPMLRDAGARLAAERRRRIEAETKIVRHTRQGRKAAESLPKFLDNELRKRARESAGKMCSTMGNRVSEAAGPLRRLGTRFPPIPASGSSCRLPLSRRAAPCWMRRPPWLPLADRWAAGRPFPRMAAWF